MFSMKKVIGLISDTHGLLRPEAIEAMEGSDMIIHAGDVGDLGVLETLNRIAPVVAVRGNTDNSNFGRSLPFKETVQIEETHIYVLHNLFELDIDIDQKLFQCVVSGHTHQPNKQIKDGVLFLNPGSAGPRRFQLPVSVAKLTLLEEIMDFQLIELLS